MRAVPTGTAKRPDVRVLSVIAAGGALGATLRHELALWFPSSADGMPWTTLAINVSGSFALGLLLVFVLERWPPTRYARPFLAIGFLGAFTTFSTLAIESDLLVKDGSVGTATAYVVLSLVAGLLSGYAGMVVGRASPTRARRSDEARRSR